MYFFRLYLSLFVSSEAWLDAQLLLPLIWIFALGTICRASIVSLFLALLCDFFRWQIYISLTTTIYAHFAALHRLM